MIIKVQMAPLGVVLTCIANEVTACFPQLVYSIEASPFRDWSGDAAVKFDVVLKDKEELKEVSEKGEGLKGNGLYRLQEVAPIEEKIRELVATMNSELLIYTRFQLLSERQAIENGTYYGD